MHAESPFDADTPGTLGARFPSALWGYDRAAVDAHLERLRRSLDEALAARSPERAVKDALDRLGKETSGVLQRAHELAEDITARAQVEADDRIRRAEQEAQARREAAEAHVRDLDAETESLWRERQRLVADMHAIAEELGALAGTAFERFPAEAGDGDGAGAAASSPNGVGAPEAGG